METQTQFGSYQIVRKIGAGGMADVYEAVRVGLENFQTRVALKCIQPTMTRDERFRKMFINEAHLGSQLHHPNIIQIQDFNKFEDTYYIAMEYVEGVDLSRIIKRLAARSLGFPATVIIDIIQQALGGLGHAHEARRNDGSPMNIIHRDVKPSNFLITASGLLKVGDFGIAKAANATHNLSMTGDTLKGTINYMSPEQIDGAALTPASDLFGVAAILFELLTLRALFDGPTMSSVLLKIAMVNIESDLQLVNSRYPVFVPVLRKGLARDPRDRYQTAAAFSADLRKLREELGDGLSFREFLAMHAELFEPYGTQPGEEEDKKDDISVAMTPPNGLHRKTLSPEFEFDPGSFEALNTNPGAPPSAMLERSASVFSNASVFESTSSRLSTSALTAPSPESDWHVDLGSVAQDLLASGEADELHAPPVQISSVRSPAVAAPLPSSAVSTPAQSLGDEDEPVPQSPSKTPLIIGLGALMLVLVLAGVFWGPWNQPSTAVNSSPPGGAATVTTPAPVAAPKIAQLNLSSTPPGASILVDGKPLGALTPTSIPLPSDKSRVVVRLELAGFKPFEQELEYTPGQTALIGPSLVPAATGIRVSSTPSGARIWLDQKDTNRATPAELEGLEPNRSYRVALRLKGHTTWVQELTLKPGETLELRANLQSEEREKTALAPTPRPPEREKPAVPDKVAPIPDTSARPAVTGSATLILNTAPPESEVYVDGQRKGEAPVRLTVNSGTHKVEFRDIKSNKRREVTVKLNPGEEYRVVWNIEEDNIKTKSTPPAP